jgi:alkanesulfonate monooxygenase SsuD/methylene tetrahydromethanopterin reductase-like flavin-dependent oxidoreductase (luciferase family)
LDYETRMFQVGMAEIGRSGPPPTGRAANYGPGGMVFVGGPTEVADRILHLHERLGHSRQILQMDVGGMPQATFFEEHRTARHPSAPSGPQGAREKSHERRQE